MKPSDTLPPEIPALLPRDGSGYQFVCYADSCSGSPGAPEEAAFASVNAVVARLRPQPELICFPGDEIIGLSTDEDALREQWRYWFEEELRWLDRNSIPLYHSTGNHTAYDLSSERVFRDVLSHLPCNGPPGQEGLTYFVRRDDLLLIFVNTLWSGLGGEGHVESVWLERTLADNADARHKFVFGHHPVHPVNGRPGPHELTIVPDDGRVFWQVLVKHRVVGICVQPPFDVRCPSPRGRTTDPDRAALGGRARVFIVFKWLWTPLACATKFWRLRERFELGLSGRYISPCASPGHLSRQGQICDAPRRGTDSRRSGIRSCVRFLWRVNEPATG